MEWGQQSHFQIHHNPTASRLGIGLVVIETGLLSTIHLGSTEPFVIKDYYPHTLVIAHVFGLTVHILNLSALCFKPYPDMESYSWGKKKLHQSINQCKKIAWATEPPTRPRPSKCYACPSHSRPCLVTSQVSTPPLNYKISKKTQKEYMPQQETEGSITFRGWEHNTPCRSVLYQTKFLFQEVGREKKHFPCSSITGHFSSRFLHHF